MIIGLMSPTYFESMNKLIVMFPHPKKDHRSLKKDSIQKRFQFNALRIAYVTLN